MTLYLETPSGFTPWAGEAIGDGEEAVRYPLHIEQLWSAQELAAIGLYLPAEADPVPDGKVITGTTVKRINGVVTFVRALADYVAPVPQAVTRRQARLALLSSGLLGLVETAIDEMEEPARTAAKIEWEDATEIRRDHALIASLADELGMSGEEVDTLFIAAASL